MPVRTRPPKDDPSPGIPPEALPNLEPLSIDDGASVDGIYSEKQMRLLTEPLYASWPGPGRRRPFLAFANVGLFYAVDKPPVVPDVLLSVDVQAGSLAEKKNNTYFLWEFGKAPEVVVEIVSNREGGELGEKRTLYARIGIPYYVVWDPMNHLKKGVLHSFVLRAKQYEENGLWYPEVNLGLTQWAGEHEGTKETWIRWTDARGRLVATGAEQGRQATRRAKQATNHAAKMEKAAVAARLQARQADADKRKAEQETQRAEVEKRKAMDENRRLKAKLRALGVEPETK